MCRSETLGLYGQAFKRTGWMPRQLEAMKDVVACEKTGGGGKRPVIPVYLNGETHCIRAVSLRRGERGELKHLSTRRKRNQTRFPK